MINNRFRILRFLGEGRSKVYLCSDLFSEDLRFAVKLLPANTGAEEKTLFKKEYCSLQKLKHSSIVNVFEYGKVLELEEDDVHWGIEKGSEFFILEYCEGREISEIQFHGNPFLINDAIEQISSFLFFMHFSNHIYFDLKSENILATIENSHLKLKFIDFGLMENVAEGFTVTPRGTPVYMAPEIIQNKIPDYRVDLYSFGILLYRLVYGHFPIEEIDELEVFNKTLIGNFSFPENEFGEKVTGIVKKLLCINPQDRYNNTLQILFDLDMPVKKHIYNWFSTPAIIEREEELKQIQCFIANSHANDVRIVEAPAGGGKSTIAKTIADIYPNTVLIESNAVKNVKLFPLYFINKIVFTESVKLKIDATLTEQIKPLLADETKINIELLKKLLVKLLHFQKFILIIDDFDKFDEIIQEYLIQLLPVLQINGCKIILFTEQLSGAHFAEISNKTQTVIKPFTTEEIHAFLKKSFSGFIPKSKLEVFILRYSDYLPGSIILFIRDLALFGIIKFGREEIIVEKDLSNNETLNAQLSIYKNRISEISAEDKSILEILSSFEINIDPDTLSVITGFKADETTGFLNRMIQQNILLTNEKFLSIQFTSRGLKTFINDSIQDKKTVHQKIYERLKETEDFNVVEYSRQCELSGHYDDCYNVMANEIERAKKVSAYGYLRRMYERLDALPVTAKLSGKIKQEYSEILVKIGDPVSALKIINEIETRSSVLSSETMINKGICLINAGNSEDGKIILLSELENITDPERKTELTLEIANAELNTNEFDNVAEICNHILEGEEANTEQQGRAWNFLGIVEIYRNNNLENAITYFEKALDEFSKAGLMHRIARLKINLGNIYNMKGNHVKAEEYWNSSLEINNSIGDIEQEGLLLMNFGIFNYDIGNFEKAMEFYQRTVSIFSTTGNMNGEALALANAAETHFICCEYSKSLEAIKKAKEIFLRTGNIEEEASCYSILIINYYELWNSDEFLKYLLEYEHFYKLHSLSGKHYVKIKFMRILSRIMDGSFNAEQGKAEYLMILDKYFTADEMYEYNYAVFIIIEELIKCGKIKDAEYLLNKEQTVVANQKDNISKAIRKYVEGRLEKYSGKKEMYDAQKILEAYNLLTDQSVTELTWKVLYHAGECFIERGLTQRAREYIKHGKSLILYIAENIYDEKLRFSYLSKPERKNILEKMGQLEKILT